MYIGVAATMANWQAHQQASKVTFDRRVYICGPHSCYLRQHYAGGPTVAHRL